ncbi:hypothetical protein MARPO_0062s0018 [Marchantia polymorpha]|uniref:Uncharacterized protein n=1 Tax=Marchantia polymorpha TaxID=3197 RepID=A0A2R6WRW0_MARPO|nr:hypothetical protein MARPO_0062s0018 [Marchantia polymorpha]|eukprot:PTQ36592.1 hypothetical protein MARPO_0062s0018 [Marchantia polymorpha]
MTARGGGGGGCSSLKLPAHFPREALDPDSRVDAVTPPPTPRQAVVRTVALRLSLGGERAKVCFRCIELALRRLGEPIRPVTPATQWASSRSRCPCCCWWLAGWPAGCWITCSLRYECQLLARPLSERSRCGAPPPAHAPDHKRTEKADETSLSGVGTRDPTAEHVFPPPPSPAAALRGDPQPPAPRSLRGIRSVVRSVAPFPALFPLPLPPAPCPPPSSLFLFCLVLQARPERRSERKRSGYRLPAGAKLEHLTTSCSQTSRSKRASVKLNSFTRLQPTSLSNRS